MTGAIEFSERQLLLLESRKAKEQSNVDYPGLGKEPIPTAPMTSFAETASSTSSSATSQVSSSSYGKGGVPGILYDDTGASFHESDISQSSRSSKASSNAAFRNRLASSTAFSKKQKPKPIPERNVSTSDSKFDKIYDTHSHQRRLVDSIEEKKQEEPPSHPKQANQPHEAPSKEETKPPLPQISSSSDATSLSNADQQKAFLRKALQSYSMGGGATGRNSLSRLDTIPQEGEGGSTSKSKTTNSKMIWAKRKTISSALSSSSGGSGSSTSHRDKAIMKKVLNRARKNKQANPRTKDAMKKTYSYRMKHRASSPRSTTSSQGSSQASFKRRFPFLRDKKSLGHQQGADTKARAMKDEGSKGDEHAATEKLKKVALFKDENAIDDSAVKKEDTDKSQQGVDDKAKLIRSLSKDDLSTSKKYPEFSRNTSKDEEDLEVSASGRHKKASKYTQWLEDQQRDEEAQSQITTPDSEKEDKSRKPELEAPSEISETKDVENGTSSVFSRERARPAKESKEVSQSTSVPGAWRLQLRKTQGNASTNQNDSALKDSEEVPTNSFTRPIDVNNHPSLVVNTSDDVSEPGRPPEGYADFMQAAQREFRSYEGRAKSSSNQGSILEMIYSEEPDGYTDFVKALKAEASGTHSQLWNSMYIAFKSIDAPKPLTCESERNRGFDKNTKTTISNMSSYLKRNNKIQCLLSTQLADDKMVKDESPAFGQHMLQTSKDTIDVYEERKGSPYTVIVDETDKENCGTEVLQVASSDSIDDGLGNNEFEVTLGQYQRKSMGGPGLALSASKCESETVVSNDESNSKDRKEDSGNFKKPNILTGFNIVGAAESGDPSKPWSNVKLRPVINERPGTNSEPSWAKVKLRHVEMQPTETKNEYQGPDMPAPQPFVSLNNKKLDPNKSGTPETIDLNQVNTIETPASYGKVDDQIDEAYVVPLRRPSHLPEGDELKIVIGKRVLMQIQSKGGDPKALVNWRLDRNEVKSLTLDISAFRVRLLLKKSQEYKDIDFTMSEDCMRFANAFHEIAKPNDYGSTKIESRSQDDSIYVEQLSTEEQKVLEMFREKRKEKDSRDAIKETLKSPASEFYSKSRPFSVVDATGSTPSSPMSTISGSLSLEESRIAESYQEMLKKNIPKDEVRSKMSEAKIPPKIMGFVLGENVFVASDSSITSNLTEKEEKIASIYRRMLKMMVPPDAVRHKMEKEQVDSKIVVAVLGDGTMSASTLDNAVNQLSEAEQSIADTYKKMLKMMVPKEAVEHKMMKDNVDPKIIMVVVGGPPPSKKSSKLTDEEESVASSYRQMLKLQIPRTAVRVRMEKEQIPDNIIRAVLGEPPAQDGSTKTPPRKNTSKPGFHWNPLPSGQKLTNSIWAKSKPNIIDGIPEEGEISKHIELFQKKQTSDENKKSRKVQTGASDKAIAKLMDLNRANNVAISLKAFKDFSRKELSDIIQFLDPLHKVKGDRVTFLRDLLPAPPEVKAIQNYNGSDEALVPAELWFKQVISVKRAEEKVGVLRTIETFNFEADELGKSFQQMTEVCHQVMKSEKLPDLLEMVRQIGNRMNEGRGDALGFKLDFLPRLAQTKGTDRKTTALDLVVMIFLARDQREALMLSSDFPDCQVASRVILSDLVGEVKSLNSALKKCKKELSSLKKDDGKSEPTVVGDSKRKSSSARSLAKSEATSGGSGRSQQLFDGNSDFLAALKSRAELDPSDSVPGASSVADILKSARTKPEESISPRASLRASANEDAPAPPPKSKPIDPRSMDYNLSSAIVRLQKFLNLSDSIFSDLESKRDQAIRACKDLSEFFCESGGEKAAAGLLGILAEFAVNLDNAVKKHDEKQEMEERKKKTAKFRKSNATQSNKEVGENKPKSAGHKQKSKAKQSLVLMVNEMLKVAGDKTKAEFAKGFNSMDPDDRLKEIYDYEKSRTSNEVSDKMDILRAIERRKQIGDQQDAQKALSELAQAIETSDSSLHSDEDLNDSSTVFNEDVDTSRSSDAELAKTLKKRTVPSPSQLKRGSVGGNNSSFSTTAELASILQRRVEMTGENSGKSIPGPSASGQSIDNEKSINPTSKRASLGGTAEDVSRPHLTSTSPQLAAVMKRRSATTSELGSILQMRARVADIDFDTATDTPNVQESSSAKPSYYYSKERLSQGGGDRVAQMKQRYTERWASKGHAEDKPEDQEIVKTDSEILNADSIDSDDAKANQRKREQYMNRWTRKDDAGKKPDESLDEDSHASHAKDHAAKTRQRYMKRWSSQGMSTDLEE